MCMTFAVESISTCAGAWAHMKVHSTCTDGQNPDNNVSYPQLYTLAFNEEGKVCHYIITNDTRNVENLVEAMAP